MVPLMTKSSPSRMALGLQRRQVRTRLGLGVALAPADLAADDLRQVLLLLLLGAEAQQGRADHAEAEAGERIGQLEPLHLLLQHLGLVVREPAAAVLRRPGRRRVALVGRHLEPGLHLRVVPDGALAPPVAAGFRVEQQAANALRSVGVEPGSGFGAESVEIGQGGTLRSCRGKAHHSAGLASGGHAGRRAGHLASLGPCS